MEDSRNASGSIFLRVDGITTSVTPQRMNAFSPITSVPSGTIYLSPSLPIGNEINVFLSLENNTPSTSQYSLFPFSTWNSSNNKSRKKEHGKISLIQEGIISFLIKSPPDTLSPNPTALSEGLNVSVNSGNAIILPFLMIGLRCTGS